MDHLLSFVSWIISDVLTQDYSWVLGFQEQSVACQVRIVLWEELLWHAQEVSQMIGFRLTPVCCHSQKGFLLWWSNSDKMTTVMFDDFPVCELFFKELDRLSPCARLHFCFFHTNLFFKRCNTWKITCTWNCFRDHVTTEPMLHLVFGRMALNGGL